MTIHPVVGVQRQAECGALWGLYSPCFQRDGARLSRDALWPGIHAGITRLKGTRPCGRPGRWRTRKPGCWPEEVGENHDRRGEGGARLAGPATKARHLSGVARYAILRPVKIAFPPWKSPKCTSRSRFEPRWSHLVGFRQATRQSA